MSCQDLTPPPLYAVHVSPPTLREPSPADKAHLVEAFNLAEEFGARPVTLSGTDVVPGLLRFARENNITQIVLGKPRRSILLGALRGYPIYRLLREQGDFDLSLVAPMAVETRQPIPVSARKRRFDPIGYGLAVLALALATGVNLLLQPYVNPTSLYAVYLVATIVVALLFGTGPSVFAALLSLAAFDFLFLSPRFSFAIARPADVVGALVFLATSIITGQLIRVVRRQAVALQVRVERISLLEEMSRDLLALPSIGRLLGELRERPAPATGQLGEMQDKALDDIARIAIRYLAKVSSDPTLVLFPDRAGELRTRAKSDERVTLSAEEEAVAEWACFHGEPAGAGTETLTNVAFFFLPMKSQDRTIGVIGLKGNAEDILPYQRRLLGAIANLASLAAVRWAGSDAKPEGEAPL